MKKLSILALIVLLGSVIVSCANQTSSKPQEAARKFISAYYSQYEKKDQIERIWKNYIETPSTAEKPYSEGNPIYEEMDSFLNETYKGMLTARCKESLIANRILFNMSVLETTIIKCEVTEVTLKEESDKVDGFNYQFTAKLKESSLDNTKTEREVTGKIRIIKEEGKWMVDSFRLDS